MPIQHIENYANTMDSLLNEYKAKDLLTEDFKKVATLEIEFKKLHKLMMENYNLNALNGTVSFASATLSCSRFNGRSSQVNMAKEYGLVIYSDEVVIESVKHRIMILEEAAVCVRIRISQASAISTQFLSRRTTSHFTHFILSSNVRKPRRRNSLSSIFTFR